MSGTSRPVCFSSVARSYSVTMMLTSCLILCKHLDLCCHYQNDIWNECWQGWNEDKQSSDWPPAQPLTNVANQLRPYGVRGFGVGGGQVSPKRSKPINESVAGWDAGHGCEGSCFAKLCTLTHPDQLESVLRMKMVGSVRSVFASRDRQRATRDCSSLTDH